MRIPFIALPAGAAAMALAVIPAAVTAEDELPRWQQATAIGTAESCVSITRVRRTEVHDDNTIDFHMAGGRIYRNSLPNRCAGLGREESFSYETSLSRLCSTDIITVLQRGSVRFSGPSCGLGRFQEVEYPES
jgi:hypothetical protein